MSVHYKFKSTLDYDTVSFDGLHISVCDLKKAIFHQKRIGKNTDFDLQVTNAQTKEDYTDDNALIAKNTSLIVSRVPLTVQQKRSWDRSETQALTNTKDESNLGHTIDLTRLDGSEDDKIRAMMSQSTQDYDPSNYVRIRGANQTGDLPPNYLCYKCHQPGHWIKNCPLGVNQEPIEIKKSTGIPRSFMVPVEGPLVPGAMMTPTGHYAVPAIDHQAYKEGKKERPPFFHDPEPAIEKPEIPEDLLCNICKDLLTDAVMIPCCGNSFCDECIRTFLLESEEHECPDCNEKDVSPETLIPNRFLRNAVMTFKNETGYAKQPIYRSTATTVSVDAEKSETSIPVAQSESKEPLQEVSVPQTSDSPKPQDPPQTSISAVSGVNDSTLEPKLQKETLSETVAEDETEAFPPLPPGTEPLLPIPSVTKTSGQDNGNNVLPSFGKKDCEREYVHDRRPRERRPSCNKEGQRDSGDNGRRIENLRSVNRRRSLSPRYSHRNDYQIHNTAPPQLMNPPKDYRNLPPTDAPRYGSNLDYEPDIRRSGEDRPGTPTVDEPHLHPQTSVNQAPLLPYPPGEDRIPPIPPQNYNQPPPNIVSHNQPLLPDPYMSHRMPMYPHQQNPHQQNPHQQNPHYGPPRYDRPQYQQPRFRASHPPRNYNGPPRPMRGMHHQSYRGIQPPPQPLPQPQQSLPPPPPPPPGPIRTLHNGNNPGIIDDPLEAFERMLREKDERDRRLGKHRRRTRSRSRTRSYSRSRSRSFDRRSLLSSRISRSRSPLPKRRPSRSPLPLRQRSRTPKRRSRSGSFSISRSRSYSRSQSPRGSISRERERDCERDKNREREKERDFERDREWDRDPVLHYRSPVRSPLRFQRDRDRNRPRSRESREVYNSHYNDPQTNEYSIRDRNRDRDRVRDHERDRDLLSTRERPSCRYAPQSRSSQHNIPPLLPHLSAGAHPPPLMSLGAPQSERKDYYDSYNRYAGPPTQRYNNSPLREPHYKRFDDVAPPGTEGYYDVAPPGIDHPERSLKDDRERSRISKEEDDRERIKDFDINNHDRLQLRDERFRERDTRTREKEERDRRAIDRDRERARERDRDREREREREKEREKDERERMMAFREREERAREKDERERREKDKERDAERYNRERREDERPPERKDYEKERHRDDRDRYKLDDKSGRARDRERKDRDYEMERERQRRSAERKKLKKSFSPHLQKQRNETKEFSPEGLRKKEKDYHEEKLDEKKKEKKVKDKKKKKDSEEKEKKKKKKKDRKIIQKETAKTESSKSLSENENSTVDVMSAKETEISSSKTQNDIESNNVQLITNTNTATSFSHAMQYEEKSLIMNPEPPELTEQDSSRQVDAELNRNPPNPNFKPIPELESNTKPSDSLYSDLEDTEINPIISEKYSLLPNIESEHETNDESEKKHDIEDFVNENDSKQTSFVGSETVNSDEKIITSLETLSNDSQLVEKSPKKDEFLAPMPELSKWERDDTNVEKLEETAVTLPLGSTTPQDESRSTKLVTSEVLKRAENAIFQKAINAIRPIEIKKISDSRKILYQNPEIKMGESDVNREARKGVNVTINVGRNERNVEITEPLKKSKLDRSKFKTPSETHSPTRLSVRERLGEKIEDDKDKVTTNVKPFTEKKDVNKNDGLNKSRSPKSVREKALSPLMERSIELPQVSGTFSDRKVFLEDRKRERDRNERTRDKNDNRSEKREAKTEKDLDVTNMIDFRASRTERIDKERERERERGRDRDSGTSHAVVYKNEDPIKLNLLKHKKEEEDTERKDDKKSRNERKRKKEHRSRSKSRDRRKRKEKKHRKDRDKTQEKKIKHKNVSGSRDSSQINEDKHNVANINFISQTGSPSKKMRKMSRIVMDRKRSTLDEASFEPDYSASDTESDSENGKVNAKKSKILEQTDVSKDLETKSMKRRTKSSSDDDSSTSASSSTESDSSDDSRKKRKKKHKKHKRRKAAKKDSSSDSDSDSASTDSSSDGEKHKKRSKKSKNKSKISKKKRKSKHK